jgi:polygalacturonase
MNHTDFARRTFLKKAGQGLASLPLLAVVPKVLEAQTTAKHHTKGETAHAAAKPAVRLNVRDFGAVGDGKTKDTVAIQETLDRCSVLGGGEVLVPAGEYLTGAIVLRSNTLLRLDAQSSLLGSSDMADYPITQVRWEGKWIKGYIGFISAMDAENIGIIGAGKIVGNPAITTRVDRTTRLRHPALIEFVNCKNVRVEDCYTNQSSMWSIHPTYCENVTFKNVMVKSGADGIDVDSCKHVVIDGCTFETTDDCISLKSGRGEEGYSILHTTEDVHISNCTLPTSTGPA